MFVSRYNQRLNCRKVAWEDLSIKCSFSTDGKPIKVQEEEEEDEEKPAKSDFVNRFVNNNSESSNSNASWTSSSSSSPSPSQEKVVDFIEKYNAIFRDKNKKEAEKSDDDKSKITG